MCKSFVICILLRSMYDRGCSTLPPPPPTLRCTEFNLLHTAAGEQRPNLWTAHACNVLCEFCYGVQNVGYHIYV